MDGKTKVKCFVQTKMFEGLLRTDVTDVTHLRASVVLIWSTVQPMKQLQYSVEESILRK